MSAASKPITAPSASSAWAFWLLMLLALAAAAPLGGRYFYFLTRLPQYEFTVVFLLAWVAIVAMRRKEYFVETPRKSRFGSALCLFALLSLAMGVVITSTWFVYVAMILLAGAIFAFLGNWKGSYPLLPVWASLLIPLRPPLGYDQRALNQLRLVASEGASRIADLLGIPHLLEGNVFSLVDKQMFMDDACSGIISLLTLMACAALTALWRCRGTLHFLLLVAAGAFWAIIFNVARVVALLSAWHWFEIDLTSGWKHDVLGYIALVGGVLCLIATDISLGWLLQDTAESRSIMTRFWNRRVANPDPLVAPAQVSQGIPWRSLHSHIRLFWPHFVAMAILVGLLLFQTPREIQAWTAKRSSDFTVASIKPAPFPAAYHNWRLSPQKNSAKIWRLGHEIKSSQAAYFRGDEAMILAVAYPYDHWHDITACYTNSGWKIDARDVPAEQRAEAPPTATLNSIVHLEMHREEAEHATVMFAFVNPRGEPIAAPRTKSNLREGLRHRFGFDQEANPNFEGFLVQALWPRNSAKLDETEFRERLALFEEIVERTRIDWTRQGEANP